MNVKLTNREEYTWLFSFSRTSCSEVAVLIDYRSVSLNSSEIANLAYVCSFLVLRV